MILKLSLLDSLTRHPLPEGLLAVRRFRVWSTLKDIFRVQTTSSSCSS